MRRDLMKGVIADCTQLEKENMHAFSSQRYMDTVCQISLQYAYYCTILKITVHLYFQTRCTLVGLPKKSFRSLSFMGLTLTRTPFGGVGINSSFCCTVGRRFKTSWNNN